MRGTDVIAHALRDAWLGNRYIGAGDVVRELREQGWYLVKAEHTVRQDDDGPMLAYGEGEVERLQLDVEGVGLFHADHVVLRKALERSAYDAKELIAHMRRDMVIKLALEIAKRKGWLNESAG